MQLLYTRRLRTNLSSIFYFHNQFNINNVNEKEPNSHVAVWLAYLSSLRVVMMMMMVLVAAAMVVMMTTTMTMVLGTVMTKR